MKNKIGSRLDGPIIALAVFCAKNNRKFPRLTVIADALGVKPDTVERYCARLLKEGVLMVERRERHRRIFRLADPQNKMIAISARPKIVTKFVPHYGNIS